MKRIAKRIFTAVTVLLLVVAAMMLTGCSKANAAEENDTTKGEYVSKAEFDQYKAQTQQTLKLMSDYLNDLQALTAGFPEGKTIKQYIDSK
jgi:outer membrane biogenesis lipoprotein LolB